MMFKLPTFWAGYTFASWGPFSVMQEQLVCPQKDSHRTCGEGMGEKGSGQSGVYMDIKEIGFAHSSPNKKQKLHEALYL